MKKKKEDLYKNFLRILSGNIFSATDKVDLDKDIISERIQNGISDVKGFLTLLKKIDESFINNFEKVFVESLRETLSIYDYSIKDNMMIEKIKKYFVELVKKHIHNMESAMMKTSIEYKFTPSDISKMENDFKNCYDRIELTKNNFDKELDKHNARFKPFWKIRKGRDLIDIITTIVALVALFLVILPFLTSKKPEIEFKIIDCKIQEKEKQLEYTFEFINKGNIDAKVDNITFKCDSGIYANNLTYFNNSRFFQNYLQNNPDKFISGIDNVNLIIIPNTFKRIECGFDLSNVDIKDINIEIFYTIDYSDRNSSYQISGKFSNCK